MAKVFEEFIYNFYKLEQKKYSVKSEWIDWDMEPLNEISAKYLPKMKTDISLESEGKKIIIDAKYYKDTLGEGLYKETIQSDHLYQLVEYIRNIENKGGLNKDCEGILIYPVVDKRFDLGYNLKSHQIKIKTIDLNQNWQNIHTGMLDLIKN